MAARFVAGPRPLPSKRATDVRLSVDSSALRRLSISSVASVAARRSSNDIWGSSSFVPNFRSNSASSHSSRCRRLHSVSYYVKIRLPADTRPVYFDISMAAPRVSSRNIFAVGNARTGSYITTRLSSINCILFARRSKTYAATLLDTAAPFGYLNTC